MAIKSAEIQAREIFDEYAEEVQEATELTFEEVAKESRNQLREKSPVDENGKRRGRYSRGWRAEKDGWNSWYVYNETDWQLTHLLEDGHIVKNRFGEYGRWNPKDKHIEPVEKWAQSVTPERVAMRISRGLK